MDKTRNAGPRRITPRPPFIISTAAALSLLAACQPRVDEEIDPRCFEPRPGYVVEEVYLDKFERPPPPECPPVIIPTVEPEGEDDETPPSTPDEPDPPEEKETVTFARPGYEGGSDRVSGNTSDEVNQPGIDAVRNGEAEVGRFRRPGS